MDSDEDEIIDEELVLQATPFTERRKVWSWCNHRVVAVAESCCDCTLYKLHLLSWSSNYVMCLVDVSILLSNLAVR